SATPTRNVTPKAEPLRDRVDPPPSLIGGAGTRAPFTRRRVQQTRNTIAMEFEAITCTIKDACRISGLARAALYELIRSGEVLASKIGRRTLVDVNSLRETIRRHRVQ